MFQLRLFISTFVVGITFSFSLWSFGFEPLAVLREPQRYDLYYMVDTKQDGKRPLSVLRWQYYQDINYQEPEAYHRKEHFGDWIRDPSRRTCFDTRGLVLERQAQTQISIDPENHCRIQSSSWYDPYSDEYFYRASDLQIDHLVPLKNAYLAGAWSWSPEKRCHYYNFMDFNFHLVAIQKQANLSKGDRGPEAYLPISTGFQCAYLAAWLTIKAEWNLKIAVPEARAIEVFLREHSCPAELFLISQEEFYRVHRQIDRPPEACSERSTDSNQKTGRQ